MSKLTAGDIALNFTLPATDGQTYTLRDVAREAKAVAIVFTCNHCPYARAWEDRINAIAHDYAPLGVRVFAINSNNALVSPGDSWENIIQRAHEKQFTFPYLYDESQDVARSYGAERTPNFSSSTPRAPCVITEPLTITMKTSRPSPITTPGKP